MDSKLTALIKKQARPKLLLSVVLIIAALALFFYYRSYIKSKTIGADVVSTVDEIISHYENGDSYITIHADLLYDENLSVETTTTERSGRVTSQKITSVIVSADVEDMLLIIELPYSLYNDESFTFENVDLTGKLKKSTTDFDVLGTVASNLAAELGVPQAMLIDEWLIHVYLDTTGDTTAGLLTIGGLVVFLVALITFIINIIRMTKPKSHAVYKQIRKLGDEELIESALDREITDGSGLIIAHPSDYDYLTKTYILSLEKGKFSIGRTEDIAWAYRRDIKNRGVTTYYIVLRMKDGKTRRTLTAKHQADAEKAMHAIATTLPIICGYSAELDKIYSKNQPEFQQRFEQRRAEFHSAGQRIDDPVE